MNDARSLVRRAAYAVAAVAFVVAAVLGLTDAEGAVAAVALGGLSLTVALFLHLALIDDNLSAAVRASREAAKQTTHDVSGRIARLQQTSDETRKMTSTTEAATLLLRNEMTDHRTNAFDQHVRRVSRRFDRLEMRLDQSMGQSVELARLAARIQPGPGALPFTGGWALPAGTLVRMVDTVYRRDDVRAVVECGSGASTVWTASAFRSLGSGHVYALEHDAAFAEETRGWLREHGLEDWATIIDAPLVDVRVEGETVTWYDVAAFAALPDTIDLLLVDGPPAATGPLARRPAYLLLRDRLRAGSILILDDTDREDERTIGSEWMERSASGPGRLVQTGVVARSTVYELEA